MGEFEELVRGYNARIIEARHEDVWAAMCVRVMANADDIQAAAAALHDAAEPTPPIDYREEAVAAGLHPPEG